MEYAPEFCYNSGINSLFYRLDTMKTLKVEYKRYLTMDLPKGQSTFLWGPRKAGKSYYLKTHYPNSVYYDLLEKVFGT